MQVNLVRVLGLVFLVFFSFLLEQLRQSFKLCRSLYLKGLTIIQSKKHNHHNPQQQRTTIATSHNFKP